MPNCESWPPRSLRRRVRDRRSRPPPFVDEAYLRLLGTDNPKRWDNCGHFFAAAAEAMRRILIDRARDRKRLKRGGGAHRQNLDLDALVGSDAPPEDLLDLNDALDCLADVDPRGAALVKLKLFAGLTLDEAARAIGISPRTADTDWRFARAWLLDRLQIAGPR